MMSVNLTRPSIFSLFAAILLVLPLILCTGGPAFAYSVADIYKVDDNIRYVTLEGNRMYAPATSDGFYIFDISDPTDIQVLGHYEDPGAYLAKSIVRDGYAFVNDWNFGLKILDVRDPSNIAQVGAWEYSNPMLAGGMAIKGDYFYYTPWSPDPTQILDISNFNNIQQVGTFGIRAYTSGPGSVMTTRVQGDIMYVSFGYGGFHTVDVSDPTNPAYLDGVYHTAKSDDHNFVLRDGYAYLGGGDCGFYVIDVGDPGNIFDVFVHQWTEGETLNGSYDIAMGPQFSDGLQYLFTWEGWNGDWQMHVWDVTDPTNLLEDAVFSNPPCYAAGYNIEYFNGYLVRGSRVGNCVITFDVTEFHVPEPATILLATAGICSIAFAVRRRRKM